MMTTKGILSKKVGCPLFALLQFSAVEVPWQNFRLKCSQFKLRQKQGRLHANFCAIIIQRVIWVGNETAWEAARESTFSWLQESFSCSIWILSQPTKIQWVWHPVKYKFIVCTAVYLPRPKHQQSQIAAFVQNFFQLFASLSIDCPFNFSASQS